MTLADERILEYLRDEGARQPKQITQGLNEAGIEFNTKYIGTRCRTLAEHGLLQNVGNGVYTLTDTGNAYLNEELNANQLKK